MDFSERDIVVERISLVTPDKAKCVKCSACAEICPMRVIRMGTDGYPESISNAFKTCINCGYCVDVCSFGALSHRVRKRSNNSDAALRRLKRIKENRLKRGDLKK